MARFCINLSYRTSEDGVFPNAVPDSAVEVEHASTEAFVLACVWRGHIPLHRVVVPKRRAFSAIIYCSAQEYETSSTPTDEGNRGEK